MAAKETKDRFYYNRDFLSSPDGRTIRILAEYFGPRQRLQQHRIMDTIVFFGSSRIRSREDVQARLDQAAPEQRRGLENELAMSRYYEAARELAFKLTQWSKGLKNRKKRFIIASGGGPGIMEAANRGAAEAEGLSIGLTISLPNEQSGNEWISEDLKITFHYFFMRKFWFLYLAKALVIWPGGFGTLDELMELLTLIQTRKIRKPIPIVLFDRRFWKRIVDWDYLVSFGMVERADLDLFRICNSVEEAFQFLTGYISEHQLKGPNF